MTATKKKLYMWGVVCLAVILAAQCIITISLWLDLFEAQRFLIQCFSPRRKTEIEERISQLQAQKQEVKENLSQIKTRNHELQSKIDDERDKNEEWSNALDKTENHYSQLEEIDIMMDKSSVGGKYSELLQVMKVPGDKEEYGSFEDYGHWGGGEYEGYDGKEGYWVYNAPFWFVWDQKKETSTNWASASDDDQEKEDAQDSRAQAIDYEIVKKKDVSIKATTGAVSSYSLKELQNLPQADRLRCTVVVDDEITKSQVLPTLRAIVDELTAQDTDVDSVHILLYSNREQVGKTAADIAYATWGPDGGKGQITPKIARTNDRTDYGLSVTNIVAEKKEAENRWPAKETAGIPLQKRKEIYRAITEAEEKADKQALKKAPNNAQKQAELYRKLNDQYKARLRKQYDISYNQQLKIIAEGVEKKWPY